MQDDDRSEGRATLASVARLAGVHASTVSRVLNPGTRAMVRDEVARRVEAVAHRLGYRPNAVAASLRRGQSLTVGVVLPDLTNPVFPPILAGIEAALDGEGYVAILANAGDAARQALVLERLAARQVDGMILATASREDRVLAGIGVPVVLVNRVDAAGSASAVVSDDASGMALAVAHLLGLGHRRIAHLGGPRQLSTGHGRAEGFRAAMRAAGIEPVGVEHAAAYGRDAGREACRRVAAARPGAIVAANDLLALGCLDAFAELGLSCPGQVSLVGHNDMPLVDMVSPPLTTVRIPHWQMGHEAARLLLRAIRGEAAAPMRLVLQPSLVVRGSTAPAGAG